MLLDGELEQTSTPEVPETPATPTEPDQNNDSNPVNPQEQQDRVFTRDEVTKILKRRLERNSKKFLGRFGLDSEDQIDEYLQGRNLIQTELDDLRNKNLELTRTNSFLKNNINPDKYDDIVAYFKGKGIDFSEEELVNQMVTHPEWLKQEPVRQAAPAPEATIKILTPGRGTKIEESEEEKMNRIFGFKK